MSEGITLTGGQPARQTVQVTLTGEDLYLVAEALTALRAKERKELAKVGKLFEEWGPDSADLLDLEEVEQYGRWRRERIRRITELRDRVRSDAAFAEVAEIESLKEETD